MARKSKALRKQQLTDLLTGYKSVPAAEKFYSWDCNFIIAMLAKIDANRVLSKNMRTKIDQLIDEGVKKVPECKEAEEAEKLAQYLDLHTKPILMDFANRIRNNWKLSDRQKGFMYSLMEQAEDIRTNGHWQPSEDVLKRMKLVRALKDCYSHMHWHNHSGGTIAMKKLEEYLNNDNAITEKIWESAQHAVRGKLKLIDNPKFNISDQCYIRIRINGEVKKCWAMICSNIYVFEGKIVYDVLYNGTCQPTDHELLKKR
tara:strand:- start:97 stop:870 length:774 start_codon:yes stop_codon:yes gene_type:complete